MGTRATITITHHGKSLHLYRHLDGHLCSTGHDLATFADKWKELKGEGSLAEIKADLFGRNPKSYEVIEDPKQHGDRAFHYTLAISPKGSIRTQVTTWDFYPNGERYRRNQVYTIAKFRQAVAEDIRLVRRNMQAYGM